MQLQTLGRTGERSVIARQRRHQSVVQRQLRPIAHCKGNFEKRSSEQQNFHQEANLLVSLVLLVLLVLPEHRGRAARIRASKTGGTSVWLGTRFLSLMTNWPLALMNKALVALNLKAVGAVP